ncbi:hypothetical protein QZH47_17585 [Pseudomonas corrugata]
MTESAIAPDGETSSEEAAFKNSNYFSSDAAFYIFVLVHLDGRNRAKLLGITSELYESKKKSKEWRNSIIKAVHPDSCKHPEADEATAKLNELYEGMKKNGEE